jgi:protein-L-isoaspartate(D-aspartate) O-methyltransferase
MRSIPRELSVPEAYHRFAYEDGALPIGEGQTISQPSLVATMTNALALTGTERVLEVGTGSGYQAALLSRLAHEVVTVETISALRERAQVTLRTLGVTNVLVVAADGRIGAPEYAPYDAILVTAAAPAVPASLIGQLQPDGRLVIPVGSRESQELLLIRRRASGLETRTLGHVRFVPLRGPAGFPEPQGPSTPFERL